MDAAVLLAYAIVVFSVSRHHEPWSDEAQAWLMARDLGYFRLTFGELRYEGHPALWHSILWVAIHVFHAQYAIMRTTAAVAAICGAAVLIFASPFWRPVRYLAAFSFFLIYQYAVIARSYNLLPLFAFLAACFYQRGTKGIVGFFSSATVLSFVSVHGVVLGAALVSGYLLRLRRARSSISNAERKLMRLGILAYIAALALIVIMLWPPKDLFVYAFEERLGIIGHLMKAIGALPGALPTPPALAEGALLILQVFGLGGVIGGAQLLSLFVLLLFGVWCYRRGELPLFLLGVLGMVFFYGFVYGQLHHEGTITLALLTVLWVATPLREESQLLRNGDRFTHFAVTAILVYGLFVQAHWGVKSLANDFRYPYSGAPDAAQYLKSLGTNQKILGYGIDWVAIEPYFDRNVFANYQLPEGGAYFHHSVQYAHNIDSLSMAEVLQEAPDVVVISIPFGPRQFERTAIIMQMAGCTLAHFSPGEMFFRDSISRDSAYAIFHCAITRP